MVPAWLVPALIPVPNSAITKTKSEVLASVHGFTTLLHIFFQAQIKLSLMSLLEPDNSFLPSSIPGLFELWNKLRSPSIGAEGSFIETLALWLKESQQQTHCICFDPSNYWTGTYNKWIITSYWVCSYSRVGSLSLGKFRTRSLWVIIYKSYILGLIAFWAKQVVSRIDSSPFPVPR